MNKNSPQSTQRSQGKSHHESITALVRRWVSLGIPCSILDIHTEIDRDLLKIVRNSALPSWGLVKRMGQATG